MDIELAQALKEIADLQEKVAGYERTRDRLIKMGFPTFMSCKEYSAKLNKAKVIINKWLRVYNTNTTKEVIKESEDFLKEIKSL